MIIRNQDAAIAVLISSRRSSSPSARWRPSSARCLTKAVTGDTLSEQLIQAAPNELFKNRTSIVMARRLSPVLAADQILVLDHGRIVERGSHRELVEQDGLDATPYEGKFGTRVDRDTLTAADAEPTP